MPGLPYLFDAALSFNNKQNSPRGQRFTSKPAGFGCRHSTENLKHYRKTIMYGLLSLCDYRYRLAEYRCSCRKKAVLDTIE